jgi:hypothetical protein
VKALVAGVMGGASTLAVVIAAGFLIDCRTSGGQVKDCWLTASTIAGVGVASQASYQAGFWRPNPAISDQERNRVPPTDTPRS